MKQTLEEITEALDANEDLKAEYPNRLSKLNKIDVIKDTLTESEIFDKNKVTETLMDEKFRMEDEIREKENKLSEYPSGNSTPTGKN